jgi:hypothetical protein
MDRVARSVVFILREGDDESPVYIGTGVFVRIGGREFILTAGHNVWNHNLRRRYDLSVGNPPYDVSIGQKPGDGSARRAYVPKHLDEHGHPDPDVAVIEPSETAILQPDREPFDEDSIGFFGPDEPSEQLILSGFPSDHVVPHERIDLGKLGGRRPLDLHLATMSVHSMPGIRWAEEPEGGRGVHVFLSPEATDNLEGGTAVTPEPFGMSGGPLVRQQGGGVLVGLARSRTDFENGTDEWCEPVVEAIRLLTHHEALAVAEAALRIVLRCTPKPA